MTNCAQNIYLCLFFALSQFWRTARLYTFCESLLKSFFWLVLISFTWQDIYWKRELLMTTYDIPQLEIWKHLLLFLASSKISLFLYRWDFKISQLSHRKIVNLDILAKLWEKKNILFICLFWKYRKFCFTHLNID